MKPVYFPLSREELWSYLDKMPEAHIFAGGTDLFVRMRAGEIAAPALIGLERLPDLRNISEEAAAVQIGAAVTHRELLDHPLVNRFLPVLAQALRTLGSPLIRNMGTIGGNMGTASPAGDTLPPLYVLDAEVMLTARDAVRTLPIRDFITGPGRTQLRQGEIISSIRVPKPAEGRIHHFEKIGQRKSLACAIASMAALLKTSPDGRIEAVRLAWGSVGPTVVTAAAVEDALLGEKLTPQILAHAAQRIRKLVSPISDVRATADYRRLVSGNLLMRLLTGLPPES